MGKTNKSIIGKDNVFLIICVCFFALFVILAARSGAWPGKDVSAQFFSAMAGALVAAIITLFLLKGQTAVEADRQKDSKVFEEKLRIYKVFLYKLCEVVKDRKITEDEEIELQFQVSCISMHTSSKSINTISKQVSEIVVNLKQDNPDANNMLMQLFSIADCFYEELYKEKYQFDQEDRDGAIDNFRAILVPINMINEYEKDQKDKEAQSLKEEGKTGKLGLKERTRLLKAIISKNGAIQRIYRGTVLFHEYFTSIDNKGHYSDSNDKIVIDLMPEEEQNRYVVLLCTRQYDIEKTKELTKGIWPNDEFNPWSKNPTRHVHEIISFNESDEVIKDKIEKVLQEVKAYRDKKYPLK